MSARRRLDPRGVAISVATLVAAGLVLAGAEGVARRVDPEGCRRRAFDAERFAHAQRLLEPCMRRARRLGGDVLEPLDADGDTVPVAKAPGVVRIAIVGESSGATMGKLMHDVTSARACGARYEVLACAQVGSSLEHVQRRFEEVAGYAPDAVVVVFGHNVQLQLPMKERPIALGRLRAESCLASRLAPAPVDEPPAPEVIERRVDAFERFLHHAAARAREMHAATLVTTMAGNLWLPPRVESWSALARPSVLAARFDEAAGRLDEAIRALAEDTSPDGAAYRDFLLGELHAEAGDARAASARLHAALDADASRTRAPRGLNERVRAVAASERLLLRDTERSVEAAAAGGLPGWESLSDNCHLSTDRFETEARAILATLREATGRAVDSACDPGDLAQERPRGLAEVLAGTLPLVAYGGGTDPTVAHWYRGISHAVAQWYAADAQAAEGAVAAFVAGPALAAAEPLVQARILVAISEGLAWSGRIDAARAMLDRAITRPGPPAAIAEAWVARGLLEVRAKNLAAAADAFAKALALVPGREDAEYFRGRLAAR